MSHWATKYIGLPYRPGGRDRGGLDCWGLLKLIYLEQRGIPLPDLLGVAEGSIAAISREIGRESKENWIEVPEPQDGCAVAMSKQDRLHHVGVWTDADGGKVIHAHHRKVVAETLRYLRMEGFRTIKFFLYVVHC